MLLILSVLVCGRARAQVKPPPEGAPSTPALERLLENRGAVERVATGFAFAEGPVWHPDGFLLFTDVTRRQVLRWSTGDEVTVWRDATDGAYGMTLDAEGRLIAAEYAARRVTRFEPDGSVTVLASATPDTPLNGPADVAVGPDGAIYFTDPAPVRGPQAAPSGVYRLGAEGRPARVVSDVEYPNGLAVSAGGKTLYVSDGAAGELRAYTLSAGAATDGRVLAPIRPWKQGVLGVPDGLALDEAGHVFLAGPGGIWVFDANGGRLGVIATPETPSNCAFGDADRRTLYVTARTSIYRVRLTVAGAGAS